jgi:hypothetical protein
MKSIIGKFEKVSFPEFGISDVIAKVDTGAYSGALHCTKIREVKGKSGMELHFSPFDHPEVEMRTKHYEVGGVRSSNGMSEHRYFIKTNIRIGTRQYPVSITLSNRSSMRYPVLLGRKFLEKNNFLVDVSIDNR